MAILRILTIALALCVAFGAEAERRRALLIGINDYTASKIGARHGMPPPARDWPNLSGAVNDVAAMSEMLTTLYDFPANDVVTLRDQSATRAAILNAMEEHLVKPAAKGDVVVFYYAGHGSQVRNSASEETDGMDESLVPADSRLGAADIRDKELRRLFAKIIARGAHLTVILDNCHSGSGARGNWRSRAVVPDLRDVRDRTIDKAPEDLGALVIAAAQDFEIASETRDAQGNIRGVFSWAWLRAMRDAAPDESAIDTFLRTQARMRAESPFQDPVISGNAAARARPLFGKRAVRRNGSAAIAVERVRSDGTLRVQGGWANGLSVGTQLRLRGDNRVRLTITALHGLSRSDARLQNERDGVRAGALLEIVAAAPPLAQSWLSLESPRRLRAPYRLAIVRNGATYSLELRAAPAATPVKPRFYYAFAIGSRGDGVLLFPRRGSVENRFPLSADAPPAQIPLPGSAFRIAPPYGVETYFLLSTEEPLPNPWVLEFEGARGGPPVISGSWTLEKIAIDSRRVR